MMFVGRSWTTFALLVINWTDKLGLDMDATSRKRHTLMVVQQARASYDNASAPVWILTLRSQIPPAGPVTLLLNVLLYPFSARGCP